MQNVLYKLMSLRRYDIVIYMYEWWKGSIEWKVKSQTTLQISSALII